MHVEAELRILAAKQQVRDRLKDATPDQLKTLAQEKQSRLAALKVNIIYHVIM